jgi:hypothetical protein
MAEQRSSLGQLADSLANEAGEVQAESSGTGRQYSRAGALFAVAGDGWLELRLQPEVAEAAARTPDTSLSPRGAGWIRFAPAELDGHAVDRAQAWFLSAWRHAGRQR